MEGRRHGPASEHTGRDRDAVRLESVAGRRLVPWRLDVVLTVPLLAMLALTPFAATGAQAGTTALHALPHTTAGEAALPGAVPETLFVYGPGGPLPAMRDAAAAFGREHGVVVRVTAGPTPKWLAHARTNADVIFSGAENMMTDFVKQLGDTSGGRAAPVGRIDQRTIRPLYLRPVAMLVRPGNPRHIRRFEDLLHPGVCILVVQGAGQTGLWEDVAGRTGDIGVVRRFRRNIAAVAGNSAEARKSWTSDHTLDVWLIWNIWQVANPTLAESVPVAARWRIYRDAGIALTAKGETRPLARDFVAYLQSPAGARIFARWGWTTGGSRSHDAR